KQAPLLPLTQQHSPDIIALQGTDTNHITLRGYRSYTTDPTSRTAILVQTTQTAQPHTVPTTLDYAFIELLPHKKTHTSLYILNTYSSPTSPLSEIDRLPKHVR
ncbi:unnamed protein product, partial [Ixodes pacificus]